MKKALEVFLIILKMFFGCLVIPFFLFLLAMLIVVKVPYLAPEVPYSAPWEAEKIPVYIVLIDFVTHWIPFIILIILMVGSWLWGVEKMEIGIKNYRLKFVMKL